MEGEGDGGWREGEEWMEGGEVGRVEGEEGDNGEGGWRTGRGMLEGWWRVHDGTLQCAFAQS